MNFDVTSSLSDHQLKAFKAFKEQVHKDLDPSVCQDEPKLLRFLKAREFDIPKAKTMLGNHLKWRKWHDIDNIRRDCKYSEVYEKYFPLKIFGWSKTDALVMYFDFSGMDMKGLLRSSRKSAWLRAYMAAMEESEAALKEKSEKEGRLFQQFIFVLNVENYSLAQVTHKESMETYLRVASIYEANYPERLQAVIAINASVYFTVLFNILKPVLSSVTAKKVEFYRKDGWQERVLELIDEVTLPAFLGGKRTDPDGNPNCYSVVKHGEPVPENYYLDDVYEELSSDDRFRMIHIDPKSTSILELVVADPNSEIEWEFESTSGDIMVALSVKKYENQVIMEKSEELIPPQRVDASSMPGIRRYRCTYPGKYVLSFTNAYNVIRSKELYVRAEITTPDGQRICVTKTA